MVQSSNWRNDPNLIMDYSQAKLIELFKEGSFPGESNVPKHVQTFISNVFLFDTHVYKFYKNDNTYFNENFRDILSKEKRFDFTTRDFQWNNAMSPSIYIELIGITCDGSTIQVVEADENADELVIKMNRVDMADVLFEKLIHGQVTKEDAFTVGVGLGESLAKVRKPLAETYNYYDVFTQRIVDAKAWMASVPDFSPEEIDAYTNKLVQFQEKYKELFENVLSKEMAYGGDIHSHNALYTNGTFFLMDTFSPKDDWLIDYHGEPAIRLATDMWSLTGDKELFEACIEGYEQGSGLKINRDLDKGYVLYSMTISAPYHYMLSQSDDTKEKAATSQHRFIKELLSESQ